MPYVLKFDKPPAGYALKSAKAGDTSAPIVFRELLTSEDGMLLVKRLEGFATEIVNRMNAASYSKVTSSRVSHLLAHFDRNGDGLAYVNDDLEIQARVRVRRSVKEGDPVYENEIMDCSSYQFRGVEIPEDHSVLVVMSEGWRKAHYFDFGPAHNPAHRREYDLWEFLGGVYNYLRFQEVLSLTDDDWALFMRHEWFPFVGLSRSIANALAGWLREGHSGDELLPKVYAELIAELPELRQRWKACSLFQEQGEILDVALDRFESQDWVSCTSILYPRIEGILRSSASIVGEADYKPKTLADVPSRLAAGHRLAHSAVLPDKFARYLAEVYFKGFDPRSPTGVSRNTVSHGVTPPENFNQKAAVLSVLIVEQILWHAPPQQPEGAV